MANTLVLYFSATGTTKKVAEKVAKKLNADTLADKAGTISHEILVNIGERVKRIYK